MFYKIDQEKKRIETKDISADFIFILPFIPSPIEVQLTPKKG